MIFPHSLVYCHLNHLARSRCVSFPSCTALISSKLSFKTAHVPGMSQQISFKNITLSTWRRPILKCYAPIGSWYRRSYERPLEAWTEQGILAFTTPHRNCKAQVLLQHPSTVAIEKHKNALKKMKNAFGKKHRTNTTRIKAKWRREDTKGEKQMKQTKTTTPEQNIGKIDRYIFLIHYIFRSI